VSTATRPDILCSKCQSTVPWAAHCPHCWAYLEFAGVPPWRPDGFEAGESGDSQEEEWESEQLDQADQPAPSSESGAAQPASDEDASASGAELTGEPSPDADQVAEAVGVDSGGQGDAPAQEVASNQRVEKARALNAAQVIAMVLAACATVVLMIPLTRLAGWWFPVLLGPPLLLALGAAAYLAFLREPAPTPPAEVDDVVPVEIEDDEDFDPTAYTPQELEARRVRIAQKVVERTTEGDAICVECERGNPSTNHFCDWCGAVMPNTELSPKTQAIVQVEETGKKKKKRRGPTRSWRSSGPAILIAGTVIAALAFAFFGPGAFQSRLSLTRVVQAVTQWVNPMVGRAAKITEITASNSLPGTTPSSMIGLDASTFWASTISPGMGVGTTINVTFDRPTEIDRLLILPGVQNQIFGRQAVASPRTLDLTFDDGSQVEQSLNALQSDEDLKQLIRFPARTAKSVTIKIAAVYPPSGYQGGDYGAVAISAIEFLEPPQPPSVVGIQDRGLRQPALPGVPNAP